MSFNKAFFLNNKKTIAFIFLCLLSTLIILKSIWSFSALFSTKKRPTTSQHHVLNNKKGNHKKVKTHYPLFGEYIPQGNEKGSIPKTILNLKLLGVLKATTKSHSQAIIQVVGGEEKVYKLNDTIPGDAKIIRIFDDSILLLRQGQIERLTLSRPKLKSTQSPKPLEFKK